MALTESLSQTAERELRMRSINEFVDDLVASMIAEGYKINTVYTSDMSDLSVASLNAVRGYVSDMVYGRANSFISKEDYKNHQ